jgi:hypothetical protein
VLFPNILSSYLKFLDTNSLSKIPDLIKEQRRCPSKMWISFIRGVSSEGTRRQISQVSFIIPPSCPVKPMAMISFLLAVSIPFRIFGEFPDELIPRKISPGLPLLQFVLKKGFRNHNHCQRLSKSRCQSLMQSLVMQARSK